MALGSGDHQYERVEGWAKIPPYFELEGLGRAGEHFCTPAEGVGAFFDGQQAAGGAQGIEQGVGSSTGASWVGTMISVKISRS